MSNCRSARAVLAGAAVITLVGCSSAAGTSAAGPLSSADTGTSMPMPTVGGVSATQAPGTGSCASSRSISFPIAVGNTWIYEIVTNVNDAHAMDTKTVLNVTRVPGGHRVTMSDAVTPRSAANDTLEHYLFYSNGRIGFPVNQPRGVSVVSSSGVIWPSAADMASGRPYHSVLKIRLSSGT